jgi:hypothetical protein
MESGIVKSELSKNEAREDLVEFEGMINSAEGSFKGDNHICPLKHDFSDDMYVREIFIPKGTVIVGKIHKHKHPNFLMSGEVKVVTEEGVETLKGPLSMISEAGTKRALHAITDLVWITVHSNTSNTRDLKELESNIIAYDYDEYEKFIEQGKSKKNRLKNFIIKKLLQ